MWVCPKCNTVHYEKDVCIYCGHKASSDIKSHSDSDVFLPIEFSKAYLDMINTT